MGALRMRVAFYLRVSTKKQSVDLQLSELNQMAARAGWTIAGIFRDEGISGAKGQGLRPALDALMKSVVRREFDMVAIWSIDRLARSTVDLFRVMLELQEKGVELYVHKQAIDTSTPSGRMMWQMLGVFAEFEKEVIKERVKAGIEAAREKGIRLGRPSISDDIRKQILELRASGMGILKIGRTLKVGTSQVQRICRD
jgi:DNA invertase Pin-like site-specific DNA recombinase